MLLNRMGVVNYLFYLSAISVALSELFYLNMVSTTVPLFMILCLPVMFSFSLVKKRAYSSIYLFPTYVFFIVYFLISCLGAYILGNVSVFAQIYIYILIPLIFINFGFFVKDKDIYYVHYLLILLCLMFGVGQFMFFNLNLQGPSGVFKLIVNMMNDSQIDHKAEEIGARAVGFFVNPNVLGLYSGLIFFLMLQLRETVKIKFFGFLICLILFSVFISGSRTSILGVFFGFLSLMVFKGFFRGNFFFYFSKGLIAIVLGSLVFFACIYSFASDYYLDRFGEIISVTQQGVSASDNLSGRFDAWSKLIDFSVDYPFGTIIPPQLLVDYSADNQFVYFFLQGGILLLLLFIFLFLSLFRIAFVRKSHVLIGVLVFVLISAFTLVAFNSFSIYVFWLLLGMSLRNKEI